MRYCVRCVYPEAAVNLVIDEEGVCSTCRAVEETDESALEGLWERRREEFERLAADARARSGGRTWDCIVPVSGGKDSYWQVHLCREFGLRPLLVTYHGNNFLPEGQANLDRMRDVLGCDHVVFGPSVDVLRRLNRRCFRLMGDMNWHAHAGIKIVPVRAAIALDVPLLVWGEVTWSISGMFGPEDAVEWNLRTVREHDLRGYDWRRMCDDGPDSEGLEEGDLSWLRWPGEDELDRSGVRGVYVGTYFPWKPNEHARFVHERYGFEFARQPFERTYRTMSNLDDMHENGIHDWMKFVKFGYGRASDHASKDVRDGVMSREEAVEQVLRLDHVKPRRDLERWLDYVDLTEETFDFVADGFRDPRVWWIEDGRWVKHDLRGGTSAYDAVAPGRLGDPDFVARYAARRSSPAVADA